MKIFTCKKCGNTATAKRSVSYAQQTAAEREVYAAFMDAAEFYGRTVQTAAEVIEAARVEGVATSAAMGAAFGQGDAIVVFDAKRRELKITFMSATGTFVEVCPQVSRGRYEDRLTLSAAVFIGADLANLATVSELEPSEESEAERTLPCGCIIEPTGYLKDLAAVHGAARSSSLRAMARRVFGIFDTSEAPEEYLSTKALRQVFQANPQQGHYDYALEGYAPQQSKRAKTADLPTMLW